MIETKMLKDPDFMKTYQKIKDETGLQEFEVIRYYARTGPSWIACENINFDKPLTVAEVLAYALAQNWRKMNIIGKEAYLFIDRDEKKITYHNDKFKDPYKLTISGKDIV